MVQEDYLGNYRNSVGKMAVKRMIAVMGGGGVIPEKFRR